MSHRLTSQTNPLRIDAVFAPTMPGLIGMTLCPGKKDPYASFGAWNGDLPSDLQAIRAWGASTIVTLLEEQKFELLGLPDLEARWRVAAPVLHGRLAGGERDLIHCRAGLRRTGLIVARLLVESGMAAEDAIRTVRRARRGTVETTQEEQYVLGLSRAETLTNTCRGRSLRASCYANVGRRVNHRCPRQPTPH